MAHLRDHLSPPWEGSGPNALGYVGHVKLQYYGDCYGQQNSSGIRRDSLDLNMRVELSTSSTILIPMEITTCLKCDCMSPMALSACHMIQNLIQMFGVGLSLSTGSTDLFH